MTEAEKELTFPQVYKNEEDKELIALNDVQGAAFEKAGFTPAGKYVEADAEGTNGLEELKAQADALGVEYSSNIGAKTLRERIEKALAEQ